MNNFLQVFLRLFYQSIIIFFRIALYYKQCISFKYQKNQKYYSKLSIKNIILNTKTLLFFF